MSNVDKQTSASLSVYNALRHDIDEGIFAPGASLPTISDLAKSSGLTLHAARRVLERLRDEGRIQSWQGKGFQVAMPLIRLRVNAKHPVFEDRVQELGFTSDSELIVAKTVSLPENVARRMRTHPGSKATMTETLRKVQGCPIALSIDYFPFRRFDGIEETLARTGSVSKSLIVHGVRDFVRDHTSLEARLPNAHEALLLAIPRSQPVFATFGANVAPDGALVQVSRGIWRADCVSYEF